MPINKKKPEADLKSYKFDTSTYVKLPPIASPNNPSKWREFWIREEIFYHSSDESRSFLNAHTEKPRTSLKHFTQVVEIGALREAELEIEKLNFDAYYTKAEVIEGQLIAELEAEKARAAKLIYVLEQSRHALQMMIIHSGGADPDEEEKEARDNALETRNMISTTISQYKVESK